MKNNYLLVLVSLIIGAMVPFGSAAHAATYVNGTISSDTTWSVSSSSVYVINTDVTVAAGVTLTIDPGVIVKFKSPRVLNVNGTLNANGVATSSIYFTSFKDDISEDTNGDGTSTTPAAGDWGYIKANTGGSVNLDYSIVRYGGSTSLTTKADLWNYKGFLTVTNSEVATSTTYLIRHEFGTTTVEQSDIHLSGNSAIYHTNGSITVSTSTIRNSSAYGIYNGGSGTVALNGNTFKDNTSGPVFIILNNNAIFSHSGNAAPSGNYRGFMMYGNVVASQTWTADDMPYIVNAANVTVNSGATLTVNPDVVIKVGSTRQLVVNGTLIASSSSATSPIYVTSLKDDGVDGLDTNNDGSASSPAGGDWANLQVNSNGYTYINRLSIRFGGYGSHGNIYNNGGLIAMYNSTVATSSNYGIYQATSNANSGIFNTIFKYNTSSGAQVSSGTFDVSSSTFYGSTNGAVMGGSGTTTIRSSTARNNSSNGFYVAEAVGGILEINACDIYSNTTNGIYAYTAPSGTVSITDSRIHDNSYGVNAVTSGSVPTIGSNYFHDNTNYGVYKASGTTVPAEYNYWGASDGPSGVGPGSGDAVSSNVDYSNFLTEVHYLNINPSTGAVLFSVNGSNQLRYEWIDGGPYYDDVWYPSVNTWNDLGAVAIATSTGTTELDLASTTRSDILLVAWWDPSYSPDRITFNAAYMDSGLLSPNEKINAITHELGHALGLGHSYLSNNGNIMYWLVTGTTTLGWQDIQDYNYLW